MVSIEKPLFRSARLKIKRADQHIKELIRVLRGFGKSGVYRTRMKGDVETAIEVQTFEVESKRLDEIALMIGDAVHNLRTALDHVAYELVTRSGGTPSTSTKFPFGETRQKVIASLDRAIQGVCLDVVTFIVECVQPYRGGDGDALYTLHTLDTTDKHRLIVSILPSIRVNVTTKDHDRSVDHLAFSTGRGKETRVAPPPSDTKTENYRNLMLYVCFDDVEGFKGRPVVETLHKVRQVVSAVVEEIERAYLNRRKVSSL